MEQELINVEEVAKRLQVHTSWVYAHSTDLGAFRLGKYLRFSWSRVLKRLDRSEDGSDGELPQPSGGRSGNRELRQDRIRLPEGR